MSSILENNESKKWNRINTVSLKYSYAYHLPAEIIPKIQYILGNPKSMIPILFSNWMVSFEV